LTTATATVTAAVRRTSPDLTPTRSQRVKNGCHLKKKEEMNIAIQQSLGIPVPIPAKKIAHKKVVEDKKPAAKKVTHTKKPTPTPKISVDTLIGNKMMSGKVTTKQDKATGRVNLF
jgi:hypothetical protein